MMRREGLRLSLLQVMKLVVFCAVAFACVAPMLQLWRLGVVEGGSPRGLVGIALFEAVTVPLAWAGLSFLLVRRGPWRDRAIAIFLLCSVIVALGVACWLLLPHARGVFRNGSNDPSTGNALIALTIHIGIIPVLLASALFLWRRLKRRPIAGLCVEEMP